MNKIDILGKTIGKVYVKECLGGNPAKYLCVCPCGEEFEATSQVVRGQKIDCGCGAISGVRKKPLKVGDIYCGSKILDVSKVYRGQTFYTFKCAKCGDKSGRVHSVFLKRPICQNCAQKEADTRRKEEIRAEFAGKTVNGIKILEIVEDGKGGATRVNALCPVRGKQFITLLSRIKRGINSCDECSEEGLKIGHEIAKDAAVEGTSVLCIRPDRALNKNSSTGHKGVSRCDNGRYRAYINFKRKQYHLGIYDLIDDAIKAREIAEKEIYGNFLNWYAETYPEQWEKINKSD